MNSLNATLGREEQKLLACVHCGLCLEACPTYVVTGDENDSPRGRLYLMRAVSEGRLESTANTFQRHIDRCLGCRACEQVCPAGVQYGELLEASRNEVFASAEHRGFAYRVLHLLLRHVWLQPARLKLLFAMARVSRDLRITRLLLKAKLAQRISPRLAFGLALLESSRAADRVLNLNRTTLNQTESGIEAKCDALLFKGCVTEGLFDRVNKATARVLEVNGYRVHIPKQQVCCGALHAHTGDLEGARKLARQNICTFEDETTPVVTNAGGCGAMLASYAHLLAWDEGFAAAAAKFSARVRDVSQQLAQGDIVRGAPVGNAAVTYDASCHLLYGQRAGEAPLNLLSAIAELNFVPLNGSDRCCGGAGVYNLLERDLSQKVLAEKLGSIKNNGAAVVATGNPGCQMQIGAGLLLAGLPVAVCHPVELLDESYERAGYYAARNFSRE